MNARHQRHQLNELAKTLAWMRTLPPDGPRYKVWLGDLVEFTRAAFGPQSPQAGRIREILTGELRPLSDPDADEAARVRNYLARLDAFERLVADLGHDLPAVIPLIPITDGADAHRN